MSGELVSLAVSCSWTAAAMLSEVVTRRLGVGSTNVWRMLLTLCVLCLGVLVCGAWPLLRGMGGSAAGLMLCSGLVGYTLGDWCLYSAYKTVGSRTAQLFMPLAAPLSAVGAYVVLGEVLSGSACLAMLVTLGGITLAVSGRHHISLSGALWSVGAAAGQGCGLLLSRLGMDAMSESLGVAVGFRGALAGSLVRALAGLVGFLLVVRYLCDRSECRRPRGREWLPLLGLVLFGPGLGVSLSLLAVTLTQVGVAQTLMALSPVLILVPTRVLFGEPLGARQVVGAVLSFGGAALFFCG